MTEWVLVPREPTAKMVLAAFDAITNASGEGMIRARWRCMLDAAPAAPQQAEPALNERVGLAYKNGYEEALNDCIRNGGEAWARSMFANGGEHIKPQQAEPVEIVPRVWREALRKLTFMARTSGGTPGPDEGLQTACAEAETLLSKPYNYPPAAPQQAEPVAQIGWADEFGNLFPMAAWKPAQRTHHDAHKTAWRPVFLHPPAAEVTPIGPREPDMAMVICPTCTSQFRAIPVEVQSEVQRLRDALTDAIVEVESWGNYAPDYFQTKHNLAGTLDRLRRALEGCE